MTIAALRRLLDEIDTQGGPAAARHNRLHLPDEGPDPMPLTRELPAPEPDVDVRLKPTTDDPEQPSVGKLLAWGDQHTDPTVQDQATRARADLAGLRHRYAADRELSNLTEEEQQLEQRLAELRARKDVLAPAKPPKRKSEYDAAVVRAWAREHSIPCPDRGRVPRDVLDAWKADTAQAAS